MIPDTAAPAITVRALTAHAELAEAVRLQKEIWGFAEIDLLPVRLFVVATKIGGQVFGAFDAGRMVGFCIAIPGLKPGGRTYLHSHMLGVARDYRNSGVGRLLKLAQRDEALARGIELVEWTFDPLELKNAYFNIERLGCVIRRHVLNQYGFTSNQFDSGMPSDRAIAEWWIDSPRVRAVLAGQSGGQPSIEARISVPTAIAELRRSDPPRAREIQKEVSDQFQKHLAGGLTAVGFARSEESGSYLLAKWDSK